MRQLWVTVVRDVLNAVAPRRVALVGSSDDALLTQVRAAIGDTGVEVLQMASGAAIPAEVDLVVADGSLLPLADRAVGDAVWVLHGLGAPAPSAATAADPVVLRLPGYGGVTIVVPAASAAGRLRGLCEALRAGSIAHRHMLALERDRSAAAPSAFAEADRDARVAALQRRIGTLTAELVRLGGSVVMPTAELHLHPDPGVEGDPEQQAAAWFAARYDPAALLTALGRDAHGDLSAPTASEPPEPGDPQRPGAVAFVLAGLPEGGSGGTHSIVQEARAMAAHGVRARVLVPRGSMARATAAYPEALDILRPYDAWGLVGELRDVDVAIATEYSSVEPVVTAAEVSGVRAAYYVQDYEPFFNPPGSPRSDAATVSYALHPELRVFAKTHWLVNVVAARHRVRVHKVRPSLDHDRFHPGEGHERGTGAVRVAAMVRPRTPRRRPAATVQALATLGHELGREVELVTFGCSDAELRALTPRGVRLEHHGRLSRDAVADVLRSADVFVDLSVYQAFGRTGLEAMACGAVPVVTRVGGVTEYLDPDRNGLLVDVDDRAGTHGKLRRLCRDSDQRARLRAAGVERAATFSVAAAAESILDAMRR